MNFPPQPTIATVDATLNQARTVLHIRRDNKDKPGVVRLLGEIDKLLDQRLALTGPPLCGCQRPKNRYGTEVWFCTECDFRECLACKRRIVSLTANICPHCGAIEATPKAPAP